MAVPAMNPLRVMLIVLLGVSTAACELIGDIFQAGLWVGAIVVILVIVMVVWIVAKVRS